MTTIDQRDLDNVDLADPSFWDDGPPYDLFERMQREARMRRKWGVSVISARSPPDCHRTQRPFK
jgi:hypothetical protein